MHNRYGVIIIGGGNHHNILGVIRALGELKVDFELITYGSMTKHYVSSSKYVSKHIAFAEPHNIINYLLKRICDSGEKEIIISCADVITELLNLNYSLLSDKYIVPGFRDPELVQTLMDKSTMISIAKSCEIDSPTIWTLPSDIATVKYPCITKSNLSSHGGKESVVILESREQLDEFVEKQSSDVFAQEYIHKKEEVQFIGLSLNGGDEVIIPGMTRIIRSQPNTNTGFLEYGAIDPFYKDLVNKSKRFIESCGYSGLFSIEFIRDYNDNIFFLEVNFRNDGNAWCVTKAGINLPIIWVKACQSEDYQDEIKEPKNILMMPEFQDFKLVIQRKISLFKWIKDWWHTDFFMEYDNHDKRPFFQYIIDKIK